MAPLLAEWTGVPQAIRDELLQFQPRGELFNLYLVHPTNQTKINAFAFSTHFHNLSFLAVKNMPAIAGLSGYIVANPTIGQLSIASNNIMLNYPNYFLQPQTYTELKANITWQHKNTGWLVHSPGFYAVNKDFAVRGSGELNGIQPQGNPQISLLLAIQNFNLTNLSGYLPNQILSPKLTNWLLGAFNKGIANYTVVALRGPVNAIPFDQHEGVFRVISQFHDVDLTYNRAWPNANQLTGMVEFNGRQMHAQITKGSIIEAAIKQGSATIPYIGRDQPERIDISAILQGELSKGLQFLKQGPLKNSVGKYLTSIQLQGPMQTNLQLTIPLQHLEQTKNNMVVNGSVTMPDATLTIANWGVKLQKLAGTFIFTKTDLSAQHLHALLYNQPVILNIRTLTQDINNPITRIDIAGQVNLSDLSQQLHFSIAPYFKGTTLYHGDLQIQHGKANNSLHLSSNLRGVTSTLPTPLAKAAQDSTPLNIAMQFKAAAPMQLQINYAERVKAALALLKSDNNLQLQSGAIHIGTGLLRSQKQKGLSIDGHLDEFDWSKWQPIISPNSHITAQKSSKLAIINKIDLSFGKLKILQQQFITTRIQVNREINAWLFKFTGPGLTGYIHLPYVFRGHVLTIDFQHLHLLSKFKGNAHFDIKPLDLPALDVQIDDLRYGSKMVGNLRFNTHPIHSGLLIDQFNFISRTFQIKMQGSWLATAFGTNTELIGTAVSNNLAATLAAWNFPATIDGKKVSITYNLYWPGAPYAIHLKNISGQVHLNICHGNIADIGQKAAAEISLGRIITLLSVESIPRRLLYHFDDLLAKGFGFDTLKGDFAIKNGVAKTQNTAIKAVIADLTLAGEIDLVQQQLNLYLGVAPHVIASLPVIVAILSGPVAGIVTWAASKVLSPVFDHFVHRYYTIKGPWHQPVVQRVDKQKVVSNPSQKVPQKAAPKTQLAYAAH